MANPEILRLSGKTAKDPVVISVIMHDIFIYVLMFLHMMS